MKKVYTKIPAMIGLVLNILGFVLFIYMKQVDRGTGIALLAICFLTACVSLILYFVDAILSIIKVVKKINPIFNAVLSIVIVVPAIVFLCCKHWYINSIVVYFLTICLCEIVSIIMHIKLMYDSRKHSLNYEN